MSSFGHTEIKYLWDTNDEVRPLSPKKGPTKTKQAQNLST